MMIIKKEARSKFYAEKIKIKKVRLLKFKDLKIELKLKA